MNLFQKDNEAGREQYSSSPAVLLALLFSSCLAPCVAADTRAKAIDTLIQGGKLSQAAQQLQESLAQNPRDASALTLLGKVRVKQRQYPQAERLFQEAQRANPRLPIAHEQLGSLYADEERIDEAITAYETLKQLQPQGMKARAQLATLYERKGKHAESLALARSIPDANRPDRLLPIMVADYLGLNQPDQAQKVVGEILRKAPTDPELVPQLAAIFFRQGMNGDASHLLRIAEPHQENTASFLAALARAQFNEGQQEQSKATIAKALALDPNHAAALLEKARQDGKRGAWRLAAESLQKIQKGAACRVSDLQNLD